MVLRRVTSLLVVAFVLLVPQVASAVVTPTKVYDPPKDQWEPFRNASYLVYQSNSKAHPRQYNAYARDLTNGTNQKLNARGTAGGPGGFDPGTNTVIFQEWANTSAIRMFDLDTQTSVHVPGAINSPKWEWEPRISTAYITFFRNTKVNGVRYADLLLYDRVSGDVTKLARLPSANFNTNDTVGEQYVTWSSCGRKTCRAYLYDALTAYQDHDPDAQWPAAIRGNRGRGARNGVLRSFRVRLWRTGDLLLAAGRKPGLDPNEDRRATGWRRRGHDVAGWPRPALLADRVLQELGDLRARGRRGLTGLTLTCSTRPGCRRILPQSTRSQTRNVGAIGKTTREASER